MCLSVCHGVLLTLTTIISRLSAQFLSARILRRLEARQSSAVFRMLWAHNHVYPGWPGRFPVIPKEGVPDIRVTFGSRTGSVLQVVEQHPFRSDFGAIDFDCGADEGGAWKIRKGLLCRLQPANDPGGSDQMNNRPNTQKIWLTLIWAVS
jgi:hypothetical protein